VRAVRRLILPVLIVLVALALAFAIARPAHGDIGHGSTASVSGAEWLWDLRLHRPSARPGPFDTILRRDVTLSTRVAMSQM